jgi:hypothetical protein
MSEQLDDQIASQERQLASVPVAQYGSRSQRTSWRMILSITAVALLASVLSIVLQINRTPGASYCEYCGSVRYSTRVRLLGHNLMDIPGRTVRAKSTTCRHKWCWCNTLREADLEGACVSAIAAGENMLREIDDFRLNSGFWFQSGTQIGTDPNEPNSCSFRRPDPK